MAEEAHCSTASATDTEEVVCLDTIAPPQSEVGLESAAKRVREALQKIHTLSFLCNAVDILDEVKTKLENIARDITPSCPQHAGMLLNVQNKPHKRKNMQLKDLPKRKKRKTANRSHVCPVIVTETNHRGKEI